MQTLTKQVLEHATGLPEGTPLVAKELLHLGSRATVDQVLSRLVRRGVLLRVGRGIYALPVESRFGTRAPSTVKMVEGLAKQRGRLSFLTGEVGAAMDKSIIDKLFKGSHSQTIRKTRHKTNIFAYDLGIYMRG